MGREILFRGKRKSDGEWIEGYYQKRYDSFENIQHLIFWAKSSTVWEYAEVDPETICQYTGYTDLRKKKAFEHDIIFYEDGQCHGHIVFKEGCFLIEWEEEKPDLRRDIHFWFTERRAYVVGNVFDNPELLNQ